MRFPVSSNVDEVLGWTRNLHPQHRYATARAMTRVTRLARDAMPSVASSVLDRPNRFTLGGFYSTVADKSKLQAEVGIKDRQAKYLQYQVEGGARRPRKVALRLPTVVELNEFGNVPAGLIKQLIARAKAGRRATKTQARRFKVSQAVDLFYGEPGDGRPAGIYKRIVVSATQHRLVPIIVFPRISAHYERRFDFYGTADRIVRREFEPALREEWQRILASMR